MTSVLQAVTIKASQQNPGRARRWDNPVNTFHARINQQAFKQNSGRATRWDNAVCSYIAKRIQEASNTGIVLNAQEQSKTIRMLGERLKKVDVNKLTFLELYHCIVAFGRFDIDDAASLFSAFEKSLLSSDRKVQRKEYFHKGLPLYALRVALAFEKRNFGSKEFLNYILGVAKAKISELKSTLSAQEFEAVSVLMQKAQLFDNPKVYARIEKQILQAYSENTLKGLDPDVLGELFHSFASRKLGTEELYKVLADTFFSHLTNESDERMVSFDVMLDVFCDLCDKESMGQSERTQGL
jgi:hypothetical protein